MGGNYQRDMYKQLSDALEKQDESNARIADLKSENKRLKKELLAERKKNERLEDRLKKLEDDFKETLELVSELKKELNLVKEDNERMKRILDNDSTNSSNPPSSDGPKQRKAANTYNGRSKTKNKVGAQEGHKGNGISKETVRAKIDSGIFKHQIEEIGEKKTGRKYIVKYKLDFDISVIATEIRIYADENGKYNVPDNLKGEVIYGDNIKAIASYLYSEGVVSIDRIRDFINSLSGDNLSISSGAIYSFCKDFSDRCSDLKTKITEKLLNSPVVCTDATPVTTNGVQTYIRNFSTLDYVLYVSSQKKNLEALWSFDFLVKYIGILCHDHETAIFHFGTNHGECNVHIGRYLLKNTEETGNQWSRNMRSFLLELNKYRNSYISKGVTAFISSELDHFSQRYDELIKLGREQNKLTKFNCDKKAETALLNRLEKYKKNHLLFLYDFRVPFSNNMSEQDLRPCKNREKMAGGFRKDEGRDMYCNIMSFIQTMKRQKKNLMQSIATLMKGQPVFD